VKASTDSEWVLIKAAFPLSQGQISLDPRTEGTQRDTGFLKPLTIQGDRMREDRIAQLGEPLQREITQVGNDRIQLLLLQAHNISPGRRSLEDHFVTLVLKSTHQSLLQQRLSPWISASNLR
jgi:hypothetical protein